MPACRILPLACACLVGAWPALGQPSRPDETATAPLVVVPQGSVEVQVPDGPVAVAVAIASPAPPPPLPAGAIPARLRNPRIDLDYPAAALRTGAEGTVRFELYVGIDGRVSACLVTTSSGSSALDDATCRIMRTRARFAPARAPSGEPLPDRYTSSLSWSLTAAAPPPATPEGSK